MGGDPRAQDTRCWGAARGRPGAPVFPAPYSVIEKPVNAMDVARYQSRKTDPSNLATVENRGVLFTSLDQNLRSWRGLVAATDLQKKQQCDSYVVAIGRIVYNNFAWPEAAGKQRETVEKAAQAVLDARQPFLESGSTLADLYDPLAMPPVLVKAHAALDKAVDRCYRRQPFPNEAGRVAFLFERYEALTNALFAEEARKKMRGKRKK